MVRATTQPFELVRGLNIAENGGEGNGSNA